MSEWTVQTLYEHIDRVLAERQRHFDAVLKGLEGQLTELRQSQERMATRAEVDALRSAIDNRLALLTDPEHGIYARIGESGASLKTWAVALLTAVLMLMIGLIAHMAGVG